MQSPSKKILITLPSLIDDPGGVAGYYNSVLPAMNRFKQFSITIFEIGSTHGKNLLWHPIFDQIKFIRQIILKKPDTVKVNPSLNIKSFIRDGLFIYWAKKQKIQVMVFFHGWEKEFEGKIHGILRLFFNLTYGKADVFIVLASDFKSTLKEWKVGKKIHLLTTPVYDSLIKDFSIENKIMRIKSSKTTQILFLSRLEKKKGVFETIDAVNLLFKKKHDVHLSIAGDGSIQKEVLQYIDSQNLKENVSLLGYIKGKKKIEALSENHLYCFPTYHDEGMPTSLLEAMAFGMSVVTTPMGGTKDFFKDGVMGYLCSSTKPEAIAQKIEKIICDKEIFCSQAFYNYNFAKKHFMASKVADKLCKIWTVL